MAGRVIWCLLSIFCIANAKSLAYQYAPHANLHPGTVNIGGHPTGYVAPPTPTPSIAAPTVSAASAGVSYAPSLQESLPTAVPNFNAQVLSTIAPTGPLAFGGELLAHSGGLSNFGGALPFGFGGDFSPFGLNGAHLNALPIGAALPFGAQAGSWDAFPTVNALIGAYGDSGLVSTVAPSLESTFGLVDQTPIVKTQFYLHSAPEDHNEISTTKHITIGRPQKNYRVVFINAPSSTAAKAHVSVDVAPHEEKTVIYVLSQKQDKINVDGVVSGGDHALSKPEVFFIKYKTAEEALHAQQEIQAQYDALGGSTQLSDEGVAPVTSVIGSLGQVDAAAQSHHILGLQASTTLAPSLASILHAPTTIGPAFNAPFQYAPTTIAPPLAAFNAGHLNILGQHNLAASPFVSTTLAPSLAPFPHAPTTIAPALSAFNAEHLNSFGQHNLPASPFASTTLAPSLAPFHHAPTTIAPALSGFNAEHLNSFGQHNLLASPFVSTTLAPSLAPFHHAPTTIAPALSGFNAEHLNSFGQHYLPASPASPFVSTTLAPSLAPFHHAPTTLAPALPTFEAEHLNILGQHNLPASPASPFVSTTLAPSLAPFHHAPTTIAPALPAFEAEHLNILGQHSLPASPFVSTTLAPSLEQFHHGPTTIAPPLPAFNEEPLSILGQHSLSASPFVSTTIAPSLASLHHAPTTIAPALNEEPLSILGHHSLPASPAVAAELSSFNAPSLPIIGHQSLEATSLAPLEHASSTIATELFPSSTIASSIAPIDHDVPSSIAPALTTISHGDAAPLPSVHPTFATTLAPTTEFGAIGAASTEPALFTPAQNVDAELASANAALSAVKPTQPTVTYNGAPTTSLYEPTPTTVAPSISIINRVSPTFASTAPTFASAAPAFPTFASYGPPAFSPSRSTLRLTTVKPTFPSIPVRGGRRFGSTSTLSPYSISTVSPSFATSTEFVNPTTNSHSLLASFSFGSGRTFKSSLPTLEPESTPFTGPSNGHFTVSPRSKGFKKRQRH